MSHDRKLSAISTIALMLAGCGMAEQDAGSLTAGEVDTLRQAAERLEARGETPGAADSQVLEAETRTRIDEDRREKAPN